MLITSAKAKFPSRFPYQACRLKTRSSKERPAAAAAAPPLPSTSSHLPSRPSRPSEPGGLSALTVVSGGSAMAAAGWSCHGDRPPLPARPWRAGHGGKGGLRPFHPPSSSRTPFNLENTQMTTEIIKCPAFGRFYCELRGVEGSEAASEEGGPGKRSAAPAPLPPRPIAAGGRVGWRILFPFVFPQCVWGWGPTSQVIHLRAPESRRKGTAAGSPTRTGLCL